MTSRAYGQLMALDRGEATAGPSISSHLRRAEHWAWTPARQELRLVCSGRLDVPPVPELVHLLAYLQDVDRAGRVLVEGPWFSGTWWTRPDALAWPVQPGAPLRWLRCEPIVTRLWSEGDLVLGLETADGTRFEVTTDQLPAPLASLDHLSDVTVGPNGTILQIPAPGARRPIELDTGVLWAGRRHRRVGESLNDLIGYDPVIEALAFQRAVTGQKLKHIVVYEHILHDDPLVFAGPDRFTYCLSAWLEIGGRAWFLGGHESMAHLEFLEREPQDVWTEDRETDSENLKIRRFEPWRGRTIEHAEVMLDDRTEHPSSLALYSDAPEPLIFAPWDYEEGNEREGPIRLWQDESLLLFERHGALRHFGLRHVPHRLVSSAPLAPLVDEPPA